MSDILGTDDDNNCLLVVRETWQLLACWLLHDFPTRRRDVGGGELTLVFPR